MSFGSTDAIMGCANLGSSKYDIISCVSITTGIAQNLNVY